MFSFPSANPGQPAKLMLSMMGRKGPSSMTVGDVGLVLVSGPEAITGGTKTDMGNGNILVNVDLVPEGEFVLTLTGTDKVSNSQFQRQSTTQMSVSKVHVQVCLNILMCQAVSVAFFTCLLSFTRLWWPAVWSQENPSSSPSVL